MKTNILKTLILGSTLALSAVLVGCSLGNSQTSGTETALIQEVNSENITLNDQSVKITKAGTYTLSGKISKGQVIVDVGEKQQVILKLAGVDIASQTSSPLLIKSGKATIELVAGTSNTLTDGSYDENADENATIYAEEDLIIDGTGILTITSNGNDAITSKDDLIIKNGTITLSAADDGIRGKDSLTIENGTITIKAGGDGLKSDDEEKGNILINGGNITISAGSDGFDAYKSITINAGVINILESDEGIESKLITINGGDIAIKSTDDGINISDSSGSSSNMPMRWNGEASGRILIINGGNIVIDADADGLDSNGAIEMNGGTVYVLGPTDNGNGALDYDETFSMNGGILLAFGSQGMAMNVSDGSQPSILIGFSAQQAANSTFSLLDANGNTIAEFTPSKVYSSVVVSTPALKVNEKYTSMINGTQTGEFTLSQAILSTGISGGFGGGFGGGRGGFGGGQMPNLSAEQQAQMEQMRTLMDKQRNEQTLTSEEQKLLESFEAQRPKR